jgi:hypothetical protein
MAANKFGEAFVPFESVVRGTKLFGAMAFKFCSSIMRRMTHRPTLIPDFANAALIRLVPYRLRFSQKQLAIKFSSRFVFKHGGLFRRCRHA